MMGGVVNLSFTALAQTSAHVCSAHDVNKVHKAEFKMFILNLLQVKFQIENLTNLTCSQIILEIKISPKIKQ